MEMASSHKHTKHTKNAQQKYNSMIARSKDEVMQQHTQRHTQLTNKM